MKEAFSKSYVSVLSVLVVLVFSFQAFAGPIIKHEKVVAADGTGDYTTITAALNTITDANISNRYRITVRPGIYTEQVAMKQFVDIVGSGQENTKITSNTGTAATVIMANDSRLENVFVENISMAGERAAAILAGKNNVFIDRVRAEGYGAIVLGYDVSISGTVSITDTTAIGYKEYGIRLGESGVFNVIIDNVTAICNTSGGSYSCHGISMWNGNGSSDLVVSNSTFKAIGSNTNYNAAIDINGGGKVKLTNIIAEASGASTNYGILVATIPVVISRSSITATMGGATGATSYGIYATKQTIINESEISGDSYGIFKAYDSIKVGNSLVNGGVSGLAPGDKLVNCHDGDYNPMPNY